MKAFSRAIFCFACVSLLFWGCINPTKNSEKNIEIIHSHFESLDNACPIFIADGINVTSITYSDEHKLITYNYRFSDLYEDSDIKDFKEYLVSNTRYMTLYQYTIFDADDESNALNDALINEGYSYCWCLFKDDGSEAGKYIDKVIVDSFDFANAKAFAQQHPNDARKEVLETIIKQYNDNLPFELDDGWELLSTYLYRDFYQTHDTLIVFRLRIPEGYKVFEVRDFLQKTLRTELQENPLFENSVIVGRAFNTGVGFRVIKNDFTDSLTIAYSNAELRSTADRLYKEKHQIERNTDAAPSQISQGSINESVKRPLQEEDNAILPNEKEILETNARLPVLVGEGTMWTKVEYDKDTKIQRFYYRFTEDVDKQAIRVAQSQGKERMKNALKQNPRSLARINAGMTYVYIYCSKNNTKLYEIRINKSDF